MVVTLSYDIRPSHQPYILASSVPFSPRGGHLPRFEKPVCDMISRKETPMPAAAAASSSCARPRRRVLTAFAIAALALAVAPLARAQVMDFVPADAVAVVKVKNLQDLSTKVS